MGRFTQRPSLENIKQYVNKVDKSTFFIGLINNVKEGYVSFINTDDEYRIEYSISEKYQNKGYATLLVKEAMNNFKKNQIQSKIIVYIRRDNIASQKVIMKSEFFQKTNDYYIMNKNGENCFFDRYEEI